MRVKALALGIAAVGSGIVAALLTASPALAGPASVAGITTHVVIVQGSAPTQSTGHAEAVCPKGQLRTGGGYLISGAPSLWQVYEDAPVNQRAWLVRVHNFNSDVALKFSAYAICAMSVPGQKGISAYTTHVVHTPIAAPANDTAEADAACKSGQLLTGGGYSVSNITANWSIYLNAPIDAHTWTAEIDNEVAATTTYDSYAVCLANKNSTPVTALKTSTVDTPATAPANGSHTAGVSCSSTELMTGGGWVIFSIGQTWSISVGAPVTKVHWHVELTDLDSFARPFHSVAMCLAKS